jgi:hypothetical protein
MPNYCDYAIKVTGYPSSLGKFIEVIKSDYNYNDLHFVKSNKQHLYRVFRSDLCEFYNIGGDLFSAEIRGYCAWSVYSCMMEGDLTYLSDSTKFDKAVTRGTIEHGTSLIRLCKELNILLEAYSDEPGMVFQEHYVIDNFGNVLVDEEKDDVIWYDILEIETEEQFLKEYPDATEKVVEEFKKHKANGEEFFNYGGYFHNINECKFTYPPTQQYQMCKIVNHPSSYCVDDINDTYQMKKMVDNIEDYNAKERLVDILTRSKEIDKATANRKEEMYNKVLEKRKESGYYN